MPIHGTTPIDVTNEFSKAPKNNRRSNGWIEPSTPESMRACGEYIQNTKAEIFKRREVFSNIANHNAHKASRRAAAEKSAIENHMTETNIRKARHVVNANRYDLLVFMIAIVFCVCAVTMIPFLVGAK